MSETRAAPGHMTEEERVSRLTNGLQVAIGKYVQARLGGESRDLGVIGPSCPGVRMTVDELAYQLAALVRSTCDALIAVRSGTAEEREEARP